jgi:hypothetical protein
MATSSMVSSIAQAPKGIDFSDIVEDDTPAIEIIIENPDDVMIGVDGMAIDLMPEEDEPAFDANLAEYMDEGELEKLGSDLVGEVESDISSRKDWVDMYVKGLEVLGMKYEERTEPWTGACGVFSTLLTEAAVRFQSETIIETFPAQGPVKTQIIGKETPEKKEAAIRVREDMNYQLTERMVEYRPEHERMLWGLGLAGNAFKKVYFDPSIDRQVSIYIPAEDVVVPYGASNIQTAERVTHVMRKTENELKRLQAAGFYRDTELGDPTNTFDEVETKIAEKLGFRATSDDRYKILEMHVNIVLEGDKYAKEAAEKGVALPYVVTIEKGTQTVLAIRRNWNPDDETQQKRNHFVHYSYIPGFGFYAFGLIHLIGAFAKSGTSLIRPLRTTARISSSRSYGRTTSGLPPGTTSSSSPWRRSLRSYRPIQGSWRMWLLIWLLLLMWLSREEANDGRPPPSCDHCGEES